MFDFFPLLCFLLFALSSLLSLLCSSGFFSAGRGALSKILFAVQSFAGLCFDRHWHMHFEKKLLINFSSLFSLFFLFFFVSRRKTRRVCMVVMSMSCPKREEESCWPHIFVTMSSHTVVG